MSFHLKTPPSKRPERLVRLNILSFGAWLGGALLGGSAGCATNAAATKPAIEIERSMEILRAQNAAYARQVEELENRVFVLNDRLDSRRVEAVRVAIPELPKVKLSPSTPLATEADSPGTEAASPSLVSQEEVEFAGEAAKSHKTRPMLRLEGSGPELTLRAPEPAPEPRVIVADETALPSRPKPTAPPRIVAPPPPSALAIYKTALEQLRLRNHDESVTQFRQFIRQFPNHDYGDNAQYWLGECFYDRKDYPAAAREFELVVSKFPVGNKVPDALLKAGFSQLMMGAPDRGRQILELLVRSYPRHEAAGLASAKLAELGQTATVVPKIEETR